MIKKQVCVLDYGSGNVGSVLNLLKNLNNNVLVSNDPSYIKESSHIILPGVGAFGASIKKIKEKIPLNIVEHEVYNNKKPFLGICVGMQVLADKGFEFGEHKGLGWIGGKVKKLKAKILPHIGWNNVKIKRSSPLFSNLGDVKDFYFVNSYVFEVDNEEHVISETDYECTFCSAVQKDNIFGVQFHPEKSSLYGLKLLNNFINL